LQQRCLRAKKQLQIGHVITLNDFDALRPAVPYALKPYHLNAVIGRKLKVKMELGDALMADSMEE
jgi:sialic acid synthase SpsE